MDRRESDETAAAPRCVSLCRLGGVERNVVQQLRCSLVSFRDRLQMFKVTSATLRVFVLGFQERAVKAQNRRQLFARRLAFKNARQHARQPDQLCFVTRPRLKSMQLLKQRVICLCRSELLSLNAEMIEYLVDGCIAYMVYQLKSTKP